MKALQYRVVGEPPEVVDIETPEPGPGQIRLRITAAGVCHSDEFIMGLPEDDYLALYPLPLTLGHEGAGIVDKLGEGAAGFQKGDAVAVYGAWGCGHCYPCSKGQENYCENAAALGITPPGLGSAGSMAEYMIVDNSRHLVPLAGLDPVKNVSLTDAGLTPYHAIKASVNKLLPGSVAVVIGAGGLGHVAIQILRAMTVSVVVALDVNEVKLGLARDVGAHHAHLSDDTAIDFVRRLTGGQGAHAVFDFVGVQSTLDLGSAMIRVGGDQVLVGVGSGILPVGMLDKPWESSIRSPYWGYRSELFEVLELARSGAVHVETEVFSLDEAPLAYEKLRSGELRGRAVVVP